MLVSNIAWSTCAEIRTNLEKIEAEAAKKLRTMRLGKIYWFLYKKKKCVYFMRVRTRAMYYKGKGIYRLFFCRYRSNPRTLCYAQVSRSLRRLHGHAQHHSWERLQCTIIECTSVCHPRCYHHSRKCSRDIHYSIRSFQRAEDYIKLFGDEPGRQWSHRRSCQRAIDDLNPLVWRWYVHGCFYNHLRCAV